jgi:hypothetical protein
MVSADVLVQPPAVMHHPTGVRLTIKAGVKIQFCPWISSRSLRTSLLVNDLMFSIGSDELDPDHEDRRLLRRWAEQDRAVYLLDRNGCVRTTYTKRLDIGEVWRVALPQGEGAQLEYGTAVFGGPSTACHFQVVGKGTFATCHSRRFDVGIAPQNGKAGYRWARWLPLPRRPGAGMSLLILNYQPGVNRISVARLVNDRPRRGVTFVLPQWGSRMVALDRLIERGDRADQDLFRVAATADCDFYTVFQNVEEPDGAFSIQHVK